MKWVLKFIILDHKIESEVKERRGSSYARSK